MNPLTSFCFVVLFIAGAYASPKHGKSKEDSVLNSLKPTDWMSASELQTMPSAEDITLEQLESMSVQEGEKLIDKLYHLSQINHALQPSFIPSPSNVPVIFMKSNGQPEQTNLNEMVETAKQQPNFGNEEVTILITGLPQSSPAVAKANKKLVQAYMQRYNGQQKPINNNKDYDYGNTKDSKDASSSEEDYSESWKTQKRSTGDLIIVNLGATLTNMKRFVLLDVEQTGNMIGKMLVQLTNEVDVPQEIIHIVGQCIGAQVAGAAGRQYKRLTGHQLRRITALDPSKVFAKNKDVLTGLARGDADFVDAIHTSTCGIGTRHRVGDIDFYVNGLSSSAPGADNIVEAAMRATRYFAESVRPGNERNFPAVASNSVSQYENNNGNGKRAYMGIACEFDLEGDYILKVNPKSPFGKNAPAQKQNTYHGLHQSWKSSKNQNQD